MRATHSNSKPLRRRRRRRLIYRDDVTLAAQISGHTAARATECPTRDAEEFGAKAEEEEEEKEDERAKIKVGEGLGSQVTSRAGGIASE